MTRRGGRSIVPRLPAAGHKAAHGPAGPAAPSCPMPPKIPPAWSLLDDAKPGTPFVACHVDETPPAGGKEWLRSLAYPWSSEENHPDLDHYYAIGQHLAPNQLRAFAHTASATRSRQARTPGWGRHHLARPPDDPRRGSGGQGKPSQHAVNNDLAPTAKVVRAGKPASQPASSGHATPKTTRQADAPATPRLSMWRFGGSRSAWNRSFRPDDGTVAPAGRSTGGCPRPALARLSFTDWISQST